MSKPILWISSTFYHVKILYQPHNNLLEIGRLQPSMLQPATFLRKSPLQPTNTQIKTLPTAASSVLTLTLELLSKKSVCYTPNPSHFDAKNSILVLKIIYLKSRWLFGNVRWENKDCKFFIKSALFCDHWVWSFLIIFKSYWNTLTDMITNIFLRHYRLL